MNTDDELSYSPWASSNRPLDTLGQLRDTLPDPSGPSLRRTSRMAPAAAAAAKLAAEQSGRRAFAVSDSEEDSPNREVPIRGRTFRESSPSKPTRKSAVRKSLDASLGLHLAEDASTDETIAYLLRKADLTDEWGIELAKTQNSYNDKLHASIKATDRRLDQMQATLTQTNEKVNELVRIQQQRPPTPPSRRASPDWALGRPRSPIASKAASTEVPLLVNTTKEERFRESDIGYFDPTCSESHGKGDYVTIGDKVHYRNVWLFLDSADAIATVKGATLVRLNLHRCLRGDAQSWFIAELSPAQRTELAGGRDLSRWREELSIRFKMNESDAMALLAEDRYTVDDVRRQRQVSSYVQSVIRHCKDAGLLTVSQQLSWAWNNLDPGLQRDVTKPTKTTTALEFIQQLEELQSAWRRYYSREVPPKKQWQPQPVAPPPQQPYYSQPSNSYSNNRGYNSNQGYNRNQRPPPNNQRGGQNQHYGQDHNFQPRYPANPSPANQQQRLIEGPPPKQPTWQKPSWNAPAPVTASSAPAYHTSNAEEYEEAHHIEEVEDQAEDESQQHSYHSAMAGVFFNNSDVPKYGLAPFTCQQPPCSQSFGNAAELRDHVLDYHGVDTNSAGPKYRTRNANYIAHAEEHVYNFSPPSSMGYAMIQAFLFDWELTPCLDTGGGVTLCDRRLLPTNRNTYGLIQRSRPITITGIAGIQICDTYLDTEVLLGPNKVPIRIKAWLVDNLQPGLIIGMDVLNRGDIDLLLTRQLLKVGDTEIPLCYTPPPIQQGNSMAYTSYHFMAHTNSRDVTPSNPRKWRPIPNLLPGLQRQSNSANHSTRPPSISSINGLDADVSLPGDFGSASSASAASTASTAASTASSSRPRKCRRCKQHFASGNLLHGHLQHCHGGSKGSSHAARARKLDGPWRRL